MGGASAWSIFTTSTTICFRGPLPAKLPFERIDKVVRSSSPSRLKTQSHSLNPIFWTSSIASTYKEPNLSGRPWASGLWPRKISPYTLLKDHWQWGVASHSQVFAQSPCYSIAGGLEIPESAHTSSDLLCPSLRLRSAPARSDAIGLAWATICRGGRAQRLRSPWTNIGFQLKLRSWHASPPPPLLQLQRLHCK